jgi:hypothetical protein
MSQLASQLQILSSGSKSKNGTKDVRFKTFKPSFMFDANTAQEIDNQTVYEMGVNGLAELRKTEERFAPFEKLLFNVAESTRAFDREGQTPAVLSKLDKTVTSLLEILSPYFLLKPAHKVHTHTHTHTHTQTHTHTNTHAHKHTHTLAHKHTHTYTYTYTHTQTHTHIHTHT